MNTKLVRDALELAKWYAEDIELQGKTTTQYVWVRHRAPYPVEAINKALAELESYSPKASAP
jgi:hypothetical protein